MRRLIALLLRATRTWRGRWIALVLLVIAALPIAFPDASPLASLRLAWFDRYQSVAPRERKSGPVTIVAVDEEALSKLGQWPWPRTYLASLIERIGEMGALAIGLDIIMPEADQTSPEALASRIDADYEAVIDALAAMPTHDALLGYTLRQHPVVLGAAGLDTIAPSTSLGLRSWPVKFDGTEPPRQIRHYRYALASLPRFQAAASGQALLSADLERGVLRRVPLVSVIGNTPIPALSLELLRVAIREPHINAELDGQRVARLNVGDLSVPTQPNGEIWLHFSRYLQERYVSALHVLEGKADPELIRNKIVIIALTGLGLVDYKTTPLGEYIPGVDAHAQMIEAFMDGRFLQRPQWLPAAEIAALALLGGLLIGLVPGMRRHLAVAVFTCMLLAVSGAGYGFFRWPGLLVDAATLMIGLTLVFASLIATALVEADRAQRTSARSLRLAREASARVAGELEAARRIQLGVLPDAAQSFPGERRIDLAAEIEPARAVGGDLYDFFMLDRDRLFVIVADVSGKGIPASLFMSVTKALTKSIALRQDADVSRLLTQANIEISRDNPESLFVTAFAAVLDVRSGLLRYWTAGHDTPFRVAKANAVQIDGSAAGPPLCVIEDFDYQEQCLTLAPGDVLVIFTDGITEAEARTSVQYGKARFAQCLAALAADTPASAVLQAVRRDVASFTAGAPASDDLTLVVLRWFGDASAR
jgi:serine phosphatase RsbU (regulator of sigma subunit)